MKKVSLTDIKTTRKWVLPAGIVALGFASIVAANGSDNSKANVTNVDSTSAKSQATEAPAPTATPDITINGVKLPTSPNGRRDVAIPGGKAHVEVSDGHTQVDAHTSGGQSGDTSNKQTSDVHININSQTNGGTSWGSTQIYGSQSSSDNMSSSFHNSTNFSTGSDDLDF
jgi:hypothetical protein